MKKQLAILFVLTLMIAPLSTQAQKWVKYENSQAKFSVSFPNDPDEKVEESDKGKSFTATASLDGMVFMASALIHKTNLNVKGLTQETMAKTSLDAFEKALGASKVSRKNYYSKNDVGIDAEIEVPGYDNVVLYRVIVIDQIQYQVVVMKKSGKAKKGDMKKFINSFRPNKK